MGLQGLHLINIKILYTVKLYKKINKFKIGKYKTNFKLKISISSSVPGQVHLSVCLNQQYLP